MHAIGDQRRGQRVARVAREGLAVEAEVQPGGAVDEAALVETEGGHARLPFRLPAQSRAVTAPKTSWVSVSRVTTSQARQPPE